jgi:alpha-beta hydrolase superfamily lysophospholipase
MQRVESGDLLYYKWAAGKPDCVLVLVHGMGAHSGRWQFLADWFLKHNTSSYSIELKGFGETSSLKGHVDSLDIYYADISSLCRIARAENPGKKVVLAGESMGGLICFEFFLKHPVDADALVCFSPGFANNMKLDYPGVILPLFFDRKKQNEMPFTSAMCTRDIDYQKVMDCDPREHRLATSSLLLQILFAQIRSAFFAHRIEKPVLFLLSGDDKDLLVNPKASKSVFKRMKGDNKKMIQYPDMLHALSIELGREKVFQDMYDWINGL